MRDSYENYWSSILLYILYSIWNRNGFPLISYIEDTRDFNAIEKCR